MSPVNQLGVLYSYLDEDDDEELLMFVSCVAL